MCNPYTDSTICFVWCDRVYTIVSYMLQFLRFTYQMMIIIFEFEFKYWVYRQHSWYTPAGAEPKNYNNGNDNYMNRMIVIFQIITVIMSWLTYKTKLTCLCHGSTRESCMHSITFVGRLFHSLNVLGEKLYLSELVLVDRLMML